MAQKAQQILRDLQDAVGADTVVTDGEKLEKYGSDESFVQPLLPLCAVKPRSKEEVRQVVLFANEKGIPLIPYSSGTNLQGAHIPAQKGIAIDLSEMNRIHLIDPVSRNVIVEPGVTFARLQDEVKREGLRVLTPAGIAAHASVIGTCLECAPLYSWPKYGPWETLTLEIVLPTGEIMGTGQMDIEASRLPYSWTTPYAVISRMFFGAQGTLGIVTKAALTVKTRYESARVFFAGFNDLSALTEAARRFLRLDVTEEVFSANPLYLSLLLTGKAKREIGAIRNGLAPWTLVIVVRGYEEEGELKALDLKETASALGLTLMDGLPGLPDAGDRILKEIDYPEGFLSQNRYRGAWNPIFCYTTREKLETFRTLIATLAGRHAYPQEDLGFFLLPLNHGATFYFEPGFYRDPRDAGESEKVKRLFLEASSELVRQGAYFDRPYPLWAKEVYAHAPEYHKRIRELKRMVDPKNIMNPRKLAL